MVEPAATSVPVGEVETTVRAGGGARRCGRRPGCSDVDEGHQPRRPAATATTRTASTTTAVDQPSAGTLPRAACVLCPCSWQAESYRRAQQGSTSRIGPKAAVISSSRSGVGHLGTARLADVEGVDDHLAQGGDAGRDHVEVGLEERRG